MFVVFVGPLFCLFSPVFTVVLSAVFGCPVFTYVFFSAGTPYFVPSGSLQSRRTTFCSLGRERREGAERPTGETDRRDPLERPTGATDRSNRPYRRNDNKQATNQPTTQTSATQPASQPTNQPTLRKPYNNTQPKTKKGPKTKKKEAAQIPSPHQPTNKHCGQAKDYSVWPGHVDNSK